MSGLVDDKSLIDACRAGQTEAFGVLVRRYQDRLYATVLRLTGCAEEAGDVVQDAFVQAYQKLDGFRGGSSFYTWVYRIAINLALSGRRRRRRIFRLAEDRGDRLVDPRQGHPGASLERAERDRIVQGALDALSPEYRAVVVLKEFDGLAYEEIAAALDIPVGTVRSRLHRARSELRERLKATFDDGAKAVPLAAPEGTDVGRTEGRQEARTRLAPNPPRLQDD